MRRLHLHKDLVDLLQILGCPFRLQRGALIGQCRYHLHILRDLARDVEVEAGVYFQTPIAAHGHPAGDAAALVQLTGIILFRRLAGAGGHSGQLCRSTGHTLNNRTVAESFGQGQGRFCILDVDRGLFRHRKNETEFAVDIVQLVGVLGNRLFVDIYPFRIFDDEAVWQEIGPAAALAEDEQIFIIQGDPLHLAGDLRRRGRHAERTT